jgi:hypothetical protein
MESELGERVVVVTVGLVPGEEPLNRDLLNE